MSMQRTATLPRSIAAAAALVLGVLGAVGIATPAAAASTETVFDSIQSPLPAGFSSFAYSARSTSERGFEVEVAGTNRDLSSIAVVFSSYACESGIWNADVSAGGDCVTSPGLTYTHPITVNVYAKGDGTTPGALVATSTETVTVPYRPSASATCDDEDTYGSVAGYDSGARWYDEASDACFFNKTFTWEFDFAGEDIPAESIVTVAFNTDHAGVSPIGTVGPWDSLNVTFGDATPSIGTVGAASTIEYLKSSVASNYATPSPVNVLRASGKTSDPLFGIRIKVAAPAVSDPAPTPPALPTTDVAPPTSSPVGANGAPIVAPTLPAEADAPAPGETLPVTYAPHTFLPYEWVHFVFYSVPTFSATIQADGVGGLSASVPVPSTLAAGSHTLAATGASSGVVAAAAIVLAAPGDPGDPGQLAATGVDAWTTGTIGGAAFLLGAALLIVLRLRRRDA